MKEQGVIEGNKLIAEFMKFPKHKNGTYYCDNNDPDGWYHPETMHFFSWDWLMPVVRKIVELCCDQNNDDLFLSDHYTSILETIPLALIDDAYKVVVEFIEWYNEQN